LKEKFNEFFLPQKFEQLLAKLEKKSLETAQLLQMQFKNFVALSSDIYLSEADFLALHKLTIQKPELVDAFSFKEVCMHHRYFPNIAEFIENNKEFCAMMRPGQTQLLSLSIDDFIKNVANILLDNGEIISVDYGDNAFLADKRMRTYFKGKLGLNIFDKPGFKDITYDINFSDMMKRGKKYGIEPLYFGHQARLIPMHCYFPENIVSAETRRFLESHPNSKTFKVCVQVKSAPVADVVEDLTIEQTRFEKPSELVTYSALFDSFKKNLVEIKIQFKNEVSRLCDIENFMLEQKGRNMLVSHDDITHVDTLHEIFILHKIPVRRSSEKVLVISILDLPHIQKITPTNKKLLP
jgi:hypothetical protein